MLQQLNIVIDRLVSFHSQRGSGVTDAPGADSSTGGQGPRPQMAVLGSLLTQGSGRSWKLPEALEYSDMQPLRRSLTLCVKLEPDQGKITGTARFTQQNLERLLFCWDFTLLLLESNLVPQKRFPIPHLAKTKML